MNETPERVAANEIAIACATGDPAEQCTHFDPSNARCVRRGYPCSCARIGCAAVEALSAAGLVITTAARMAEMMDELRMLRAEVAALKGEAVEAGDARYAAFLVTRDLPRLTRAQRLAGLARSFRMEAAVLGEMRSLTLSRDALRAVAADLDLAAGVAADG